VLLAILPALDNLELAMSHADADHGRLIEGVSMIIQQFHQGLVRLGVVRVPAEPGELFDPEIHEAMLE
jgi:molecular chaperone GrpE